MPQPQPVLTAHFLLDLPGELLRVLASLTPEEWELPTPCPVWSVHDLAACLLTGIPDPISGAGCLLSDTR